MSTPDHTPISQRALDDLVIRARVNNDYFTGQKLLRRIDRAVPGMTALVCCAPSDVQHKAQEARRLFKAVVNEAGNLEALEKLKDILAIAPDTQGSLLLTVAELETEDAEEVLA